ncbi:hypothetical protein FPQ18DRAFT_354218 [Pyronema domesticum]|nr:hypothetical protein FPQ18DRAFT_354218 [Pyronema domesticum]
MSDCSMFHVILLLQLGMIASRTRYTPGGESGALTTRNKHRQRAHTSITDPSDSRDQPEGTGYSVDSSISSEKLPQPLRTEFATNLRNRYMAERCQSQSTPCNTSLYHVANRYTSI